MCSSKILAIFFLFFACVNAFNYDRYYGFIEAPQRRFFEESGDRVPSKDRRAPLEGFEDMSGFLRQIDGIQKPRFGRK
ncbi:unnamed protein product [Caenorhabditis angaria]|uniref:Uncharacterized protein n=1 Tax=Caenorhabditis angaria TaxID=860376 RepID=A0A9P1I423_9PELO|nr:unnamed protein product [Caenorhabditis angaria]